MADLSSLSKEQLLQLLQQKEAAEQLQSQGIPPQSAAAATAASPKKESAFGGPCHYRPVRSNQGACTDPAVSEWGFCKKHSRTVQARKAHEKWEAENAPPQASPVASPVQTPVQAVSQPPPISTGTTRVDLDAELDRLEGEVLEEEDVDAMEQLARANAKKTKPVRSRVQEEISPAKPKSGGRRVKASPKKSPKQKTSPAKRSAKPKARTSRPKAARKPAVRKKVIRPNFWGRFEDTETHIVFDPTTKCAYGVQDATGKVLALTAKHITICERNGWNYNAPEVDYESESEEDYEEVEEVTDEEVSSEEEESEEVDGSEEEEDEVEGSEEVWDSEEEDEVEGSDEEVEGSSEYYDEDEDSDEYEEVTDEDEYYDE